jgi:hypothetical protein
MIQEELQKLERLAVLATKKLDALNAENEQLRHRLSALEHEIQRKDQEIYHFKNRIKISNIVDNRPVNPEDAAEMSDLINKYIQEIDQLITYLSEK